ncbi:Pycsar system effector family protein [Streptomyces sp. NPDC020875]|uniref:Pycsar system effector family protein n=1 Tax=Streptomyces sp. NPDC020875 TaxID=3154898 RepID=UPI0033E37CD5
MTTQTAAPTVDENFAAALAHVTSEVTRTDSKAAALLTLDGLLVAGIGLLGTKAPWWSLVLGAIGGVAIAGSVVMALLVIRPRLARAEGVTPNGSFLHFASTTPSALAAHMTVDYRADRITSLSRICLTKMRFLRRSGDLALVAVLAVAAALLTR